ncbi:MAG: type I glyceraldehyde-3-phosphate dehydrogenase [Erysipelotrichaceae bacterium]|nr:type I glyceraldehyde-3-phosphate dehydrogenase [Erysipelotrichaceae bacterium]
MRKIAINGFGRIGRLVFRIMEEDPELEVVAINDLTDSEQLAYLLKYDTNHRVYRPDEITYDEEAIIIGDRRVLVYSEMDPKKLPWGELGIDLVFECTGKFVDKEKAYCHIEAGAKKVIISAPAKGDLKTIVYHVNDDILDGSEEIISAASCTTNCLAPVLKVLQDHFGIVKGYMTTIHAYTNDQVTLDVAHKKGIASRRGRACAMNIVPSSTGAASAIGKVIPELDGKLKGSAMRVPVSDGSLVDLTLELKQNTSIEEINEVFKGAVNETLHYTDDPIVSSDIISSTCGATVDGRLTDVVEVDGKQLVKVVAWYDNEMGYSAQMVRTAKKLMENV